MCDDHPAIDPDADDRPPALTRRDLMVTGGLALAGAVMARALPEPPAPPAVPATRGSRRFLGPPVTIHPRAEWATGRPPKRPIPAEDVKFLLVHHTASSNSYGATQVPSILRQTYDFQTGPTKGWPDVCYEFFVDRYGGVWEGRAGSLAGPVVADATGGSQGFAQLVCLIGDFTSELPTPAALTSLTLVLGWLADRHAISTEAGATTTFTSRGSQRYAAGQQVTTATIAPHRSMSYTACPGAAFSPYVRDQLQADVHRIRTGR